MIYPIEDNYEEFENKHYKDFIKYLKKRKFENLESYEKRFLMRILEGVDWKLKDAHEELNIHLNFLSETLPIILTEPMMELIDSGYYYMHGRDRSLRPIMIVSPKEILGLGLEPHDGIMAIHFVAQYVLNHKMYPGKIENVLTVIDLAHLSFTALPKKWIMIFIKNFNHNYYQINTMMINLNTTWSIRMLWKMSKSFIHPIVRNKTVFSKFNTCSELEDLVHPKQLQQKYGGEADNVTVFWPPYSPSNEYGVDPNKIKPLPKGEQDIERNMNEENEVRDVDQIILEERFRNAQSVSHLESVQSNIDAKNDLQYSDSSSQKKCKCECQCIIF